MKKIPGFVAILALLILSFAFNGFKNMETLKSFFNYKKYELSSQSVLEINGKTNVNSFCCSSRERFPTGEIAYQLEVESAIFYLKKTNLKINIQELDCGAKPINKDLQKTLRADQFPHITISLQQASNLNCSNTIECESWVEFEAIADITLANITKTVNIPIFIKKKENHRFRVNGATSLLFKDFGLEPPTALMGLIKVKESIDIRFDLDVTLL